MEDNYGFNEEVGMAVEIGEERNLDDPELVSEAENFSVSQMKLEDDDPLKMYLAEIAAFPQLTKEEELELGKAKDAGDEEARETLINCNLRLVVALAKKRYDQISKVSSVSTTFEDLIQDGCGGLITAVDRYDWMKNCKFSTNAVYWINQAINAGISQNSRLIRIPDHTVDKMALVKCAEAELSRVLNREPSVCELGAYLNHKFSSSELVEIRGLILKATPVSLDETVGEGDDDGNLSEVIPSEAETPSEYANRVAMEDAIDEAINRLPEKERLVLVYSFGLFGYEKKTLTDIAKILLQRGYANRNGKEITKEGVRQLKEKALRVVGPVIGEFAIQ